VESYFMFTKDYKCVNKVYLKKKTNYIGAHLIDILLLGTAYFPSSSIHMLWYCHKGHIVLKIIMPVETIKIILFGKDKQQNILLN
jgi:hypothetical protein